MQSVNGFGFEYQGLGARAIFNIPNRCDTNLSAAYRAALRPGASYWDNCANRRMVFFNNQWHIDSTAGGGGGGGTGIDTTALHIAQNLADLSNVTIAQNNLGISAVGRTNQYGDLSGKPTTVATSGLTDAVPAARTLTINGVPHDLSANQSWTVTAAATDTTSLSARINLKKDKSDSVAGSGYTTRDRLLQMKDSLGLAKVTNAGGVVLMGSGTYAAKPSAAAGKGLYYATDSLFLLYSDGSAWFKITDRAGIISNIYIKKDGGRGINLGRGHDSSIIFKGLVDSGAFHWFLNPDSTVTGYVATGGGGSFDTTTIEKRIDSVSKHLADTVTASVNGRATPDEYNKTHSFAVFFNDRTDNTTDSMTYASGLNHYDKGIKVYSSDATISITKEHTQHSTIYNVKLATVAGSIVTGNIPGSAAGLTANIAESQVTNLVTDLGLKAPLASAALTGTPTAPTATAGTNTTQLATTAFVTAAVAAAGGTSFYQTVQTAGTPVTQQPKLNFLSEFTAANNGANSSTDVSINAIAESKVTALVSDLGLKAPLASPALTGTPTAPTATPGNNSTQVSTTAYADAIAALKANLASPALTGTPTAPTATTGTNSSQLANTAFVQTAIFGLAPLASPALTGVPTAPTAAPGTSTTQVATTAFVGANQVNVYNTDGTLTGNRQMNMSGHFFQTSGGQIRHTRTGTLDFYLEGSTQTNMIFSANAQQPGYIFGRSFNNDNAQDFFLYDNVTGQQIFGITGQTFRQFGTMAGNEFQLGYTGGTTGVHAFTFGSDVYFDNNNSVGTTYFRTAGGAHQMGLLSTGQIQFVPASSVGGSFIVPTSAGVNPTTPIVGETWYNGTNLFFHKSTGNVDLLAGGGTPSYQTVAANGTARTQRPTINFKPEFTAVDNPGTTSTDIGLTSIPSSTTATTQLPNDNTTKVATTAYADAAVAGAVLSSGKLIYSATASGTALTNTTTPASIVGTGVGTRTVLANTLTAGKTITIHGWLQFSTGVSGNNITILPTNTSFGIGTTFSLPGSNTNTWAEINVTHTIVSTGASGVMFLAGTLVINGLTVTIAEGFPQTFNTTINQTFDIVAFWGTASASNSIQMLPNYTIKVE